MNKGDSGQDVCNTQNLLLKAGYTISSNEIVAKLFGLTTKDSVTSFQNKNKLTADGIVGPNTLNALKASIALGNATTPVIGVDNYIQMLIDAGISANPASFWGFGLHAALTESGIITNKSEVCSLTANVLHETGQLTCFEENLNYSSTALLSLWPTHFTKAQAEQYGRTPSHPADQRMIANLAYANRMGNGGPETNDGWTHRGQGPFQLTGANNYKAFSAYSGEDVISNPEKLSKVVVGAKSAIWFWIVNKCGPSARALDHKGVCNKINGGENGLAHRIALTEFFLSKMN